MKLMLNINQRKSLALGHDAPHSTEVLEFDPAQLPEDVRVFLAAGYSPHNSQWRMQRQWTDGYCTADLPAVTVPVTVDSIIGAVREMQEYIRAQDAALAVQAQEKAEQQARLEAEQERLAAEISAQIENGTFALGELHHSTSDGVTDVFSTGVYGALEGYYLRTHQRLTAAAWDRIRAVYAANEADKLRVAAESQAAAERAAREQQEAAVAFVREHMDANANERFAAGVLPASELETAMADKAFAALAAEQPYSKLTAAEVVHVDEADTEHGHEAQFEADDKTTLTAVEWNRKRELEAKLPGCTVVVRHHRAYCENDDCCEITYRTGYRVTATICGRTFTREYGE
jgi:hypothetical protein